MTRPIMSKKEIRKCVTLYDYITSTPTVHPSRYRRRVVYSISLDQDFVAATTLELSVSERVAQELGMNNYSLARALVRTIREEITKSPKLQTEILRQRMMRVMKGTPNGQDT